MQLLKISMDLEMVNPNTFFGHSILQGLREKKLMEIIQTVKDQAKDNRELCIECLGKGLLDRILKYNDNE